mmetsp:Transcript_2210/g.3493  ORF Transcript_2210/g.3493 Transcript_2210/m.3493 type:complete len:119 (-) Transcript_2210:1083-1439(-)
MCTASNSFFEGESPNMGIDRGLRGEKRRFDDANGDIEIMLLMPPLAPPRFDFGDANSPLRGKDATSEKKKDVCVGVRGVRARGVLSADPNPPPGENNPLAVGDCNQANTLLASKLADD